MNATPITCPACGELVIALIFDSGAGVMIPIHPDRISPFITCLASARRTPLKQLR